MRIPRKKLAPVTVSSKSHQGRNGKKGGGEEDGGQIEYQVVNNTHICNFFFRLGRRLRLFYSMIMSLLLLLGRPGDHLPAGILSLDILTNLSASTLVICWSHSLLLLLLLCTHLLNRLNTAGFSDLLTSYSIYFSFANYFT